MSAEACSLERFRKDTAEHQMQILLDSGMHRHLRFRRPGTNTYGFDVVTWPGYLAISGDMGGSMFTRLPDMFEFFRKDQRWYERNPGGLPINPSYWAGKLAANDGEKKRFNIDRFARVVRDHFDGYMSEQDSDADGFEVARDALWKHITAEVLAADYDDSNQAIAGWSQFEVGQDNTGIFLGPADVEAYAGWFDDFKVADVWEYVSSIESYTFHLIWRMYAVAHAVQTYDAHHASFAAPVTGA